MLKVAAPVMFVLLASNLFADDEIKLTNGDHVSGTITSLAGGKLIIETAYAGKLVIDWTKIVSVRTDAPVKVKLSTDEVLEGKLSAGQEGRLKVETAGQAQPAEVDLTKIKSFNEPPTQWHGNLNAAGKVTEGNTRTKAFLISAEGTRETEQDLFLVRAIFHYGEQSGTLTERNSYGLGKYQYKLTPALYAYGSAELMSDTFKDLELETILSAGLGYDLIKEKWMDLSAEAGLAYFDNNYRLSPDESHLGARASVKLRVALPLGFELRDLFTIYPNFKDSQNYQLRNEATFGTALGGGWNLLGGVITEYNNKPALAGVKQTDDTYFIGLGYTF